MDKKITKLGLKKVKIPKDWGVINGSKCIQLESGSRPKGGAVDSGVPSLGGEHIDRGLNKVDFFTSPKYIPKNYYEKLNSGLVQKNDILINKDGAWTGKVAFIPELFTNDIAVNEHLFIIRNKGQFKQKFLFYFFCSYYGQSQIDYLITGAAQPGINTKFINNFNIPLPSLPEQEKIANILSSVDELITKTNELITKNKELKKGLMQELLTKGIGHNEYKKVKIGPKEIEIPKEWELEKLNKLCNKISDGTHKTPKYVDEGIPFVSTNNLIPFQEGFDFSSYQKFITPKEHKELVKRCKPEKGDILISKCGTIGRSKLIDVDYEFSIFVGLGLLKLNKNKINPIFIEQLLNYRLIQYQMNLLAPGSTRKTLTIKGIKNIKIPLPSFPEQEKIATILSSVDDKIKKEQDYKEQLLTLKKGLMQELLTGKVRVEV